MKHQLCESFDFVKMRWTISISGGRFDHVNELMGNGQNFALVKL